MIKRILNYFRDAFFYLWVAPITIPCFLFYIGPFWALGWYKFYCRKNRAFCWMLADSAPKWLVKLWGGFAGQTIGHCIVYSMIFKDSVLFEHIVLHEQEHIRQEEILGIFQPIIYGLIYLTGKILGYDPTTNSLESEARRAGHQVIDVVGMKEKLSTSKSKLNIPPRT